MSTLHSMADALIKYETIDVDQIKELMAGKAASPPADWEDFQDDDETPEGGEASTSKKSKKKSDTAMPNFDVNTPVPEAE